MNISSTICWCNIYHSNSIQNVGPNVLALRQANLLKFMQMTTGAVSYFKAETVANGLNIHNFAGHNRFPLFAFDETVLCPRIFIYKYPEMTRFATLPTSMLTFTALKFSELDLLIAVGGYPSYPICVFNFRTNTKILEHPTNIITRTFTIALSSSNSPSIVQYNRENMVIYCYEMCFIEKDAYLHQVSEVEMGKKYVKSADHFMCFSEDSGLYVVNDYGEFSQIDIACFAIKSRWSPMLLSEYGREMVTRAHSVVSHKMGFLIANNSTAFYIKKKAGNFAIEWTIEQGMNKVDMFISNPNGELYASQEFGIISQVGIEESLGKLQKVVNSGKAILAFRTLNCFKEEVVVVLHNDGVAMMDLAYGKTLSEVEISLACSLCSHRMQAFVVVGTVDGYLMLINYEKPSVANIVFELQCDTAAVFSIAYHDNCIVFQDQAKGFHVVNVEYRPIKMTYYFAVKDEQLLREVFVHSFLLVEGPRLLVMIARDKTLKAPAYAEEMWIYNWTKDRRLHRRELPLPNQYVSFFVQAPMGRWVTVEIIAAVKDSPIVDQFVLNEASELQWVSSIKTSHYGHITGVGLTKHLTTWSVDGIMVHFRQHKRSKKPYMISRFVTIFFAPECLLRARECYNSKYLIVLNAENVLWVARLPSLADNARENEELPVPPKYVVQQTRMVSAPFVPLSAKLEVKEQYSPADILKREKIMHMIQDFAAKVTALINYDISVTGKTKGVFKKFCYHYKWLEALTDEAHKLCALERESLMRAIEDQSRIRDWIMRLVTRDAININYKVRSISAEANFESFSLVRKPNMLVFDKYRFYDLEDHMRFSALSMDGRESERTTYMGSIAEMKPDESKNELKQYVVEGTSVYEHIMAPQFQLQTKSTVTSNQIFNDNCKFNYYLADPLKQEFNKQFHEAQQLKRETIDNVLNTNGVLTKIYDNMNIMLRLLHMETFQAPALTAPSLAKDEVIKYIMEVDDSEIKAINRRRRKTIDTGGKRGRLLLWSAEFWARALIVMMDGVIEKLWEEEIKKDIPIPEFVFKKQPHEYSLEDQKIYRAYEEAVHQLELDRRKYLGILHDNEGKTLQLKTKHILKLNQRVAELMLMKLKYDFALTQNLVRMLNLKTINHVRDKLREKIKSYRNNYNKLNDYIKRYTYLLEFWEATLTDVRGRLEAQQVRDRALERQFRGNYLNTVPHASHEMTKLFKKRPKLSNKLFSTSLICSEVAHKLSPKQINRNAFPMPKEINDFLALVAENDGPKNCPPQVDAKSWEAFVKLRRQKIESELRLKGVGYQLIDSQSYINSLTNDIVSLKESQAQTKKQIDDTIQQYLEAMRNMTLQLTLTLGQVEVNVRGNTKSLENCVLMHVDDINDVNSMIKDAGMKKIKAMQRVAVFRRQVIFKEWEHKLYKANIAYLKYMLEAIEKCKVTIDFLNILRNWEKVKADRQKYMVAGAIERIMEQKIAVFRKQIERVNIKIDSVKEKTLEIKRRNHVINAKIERLKIDVAFQNSQRDIMMEQRRDREQRERMEQIKTHRQLLDNVRKHYAHVLELQTILELLRLRTYPTLGPPLPQCHPPVPEYIVNSVP
ncbi:cilia- and flagella-associated protein 43 [Drosophila sulfurigaster albostrigata]|uniref:cilia- and flagella-associated protein 43 n=1 Tax=Drosophila sulfurigaster albostrigata TaxID=89887 RepID=UPI002D21DCCE|nr:cilia- and flagella-associated protein 43 [Drosophila sulfurigaster albostrigata]